MMKVGIAMVASSTSLLRSSGDGPLDETALAIMFVTNFRNEQPEAGRRRTRPRPKANQDLIVSHLWESKLAETMHARGQWNLTRALVAVTESTSADGACEARSRSPGGRRFLVGGE